MQIDTGNQAYFNLSIVGKELRFVVVTPELSVSHDCGVFEKFSDFLYLKYNLECSDGNTTDIVVSAAFGIRMPRGSLLQYICTFKMSYSILRR